LGLASAALLFPPIQAEDDRNGFYVGTKVVHPFLFGARTEKIMVTRLALELLPLALVTFGAIASLKDKPKT